jgi:uncharacterized protein
VTPCFVDTFFFIALLNGRDRTYHEKARLANRANRPMVTSAWVLTELADHLCDQQNRVLYGQVLSAVHSDARFTVVEVDPVVLAEATQLYLDRTDKDWSLTDCTSFVLMGRQKLTEALTADHHFEQAGFVALLK